MILLLLLQDRIFLSYIVRSYRLPTVLIHINKYSFSFQKEMLDSDSKWKI